MKCASIDAQTRLRAKMAFQDCRISNDETAINFLTRLEQKANEARNFDRHYKERITSFLAAFELNKNIMTQKWIENKFYSMNEERMNFHRQRLFKESARFTYSNPTQNNNRNQRQSSDKKIVRCKWHFACNCLPNMHVK